MKANFIVMIIVIIFWIFLLLIIGSSVFCLLYYSAHNIRSLKSYLFYLLLSPFSTVNFAVVTVVTMENAEFIMISQNYVCSMKIQRISYIYQQRANAKQRPFYYILWVTKISKSLRLHDRIFYLV